MAKLELLYQVTNYIGTVLSVSRDAVAQDLPQRPSKETKRESDTQNEREPPDSAGYVARVALDRTTMMTEAGALPLGPGMDVTAKIKTGRRTVISYLLSPLLRYKQESLRER